MKICTFLWVYYGYPASSYEGMSVEQMRYLCGAKWQSEIMLSLMLLQVCRIRVLHTQLVMQMLPVFRSQDRLLNTHQHGRDPLCLQFRASVILLQNEAACS